MDHPFESFKLTGKNVFVTGGSMGIGYHMALGLARSGASVVIGARTEKSLVNAVGQITEESGNKNVSYIIMDLADVNSINECVKKINLGGIDIFIGNAALGTGELIGSITIETLLSMYQVNLSSNILLMQSFIPRMKARKWGRIIFSSSIGSRLAAGLGTSVYAACKGGLNAFTRAAATELGRSNITVNSIILGVYRTRLFEALLDKIKEEKGIDVCNKFLDSFTSMSALGRLAYPEEIEGIIQCLASNAGSYITGSEITVDGGMSIMMKPLLDYSEIGYGARQ